MARLANSDDTAEIDEGSESRVFNCVVAGWAAQSNEPPRVLKISRFMGTRLRRSPSRALPFSNLN